MDDVFDSARTDNARQGEEYVLKVPVELVLDIGRDGENMVLIIEDDVEDFAYGKSDCIEGRAFLGNDLIGFVPDVIMKSVQIGGGELFRAAIAGAIID